MPFRHVFRPTNHHLPFQVEIKSFPTVKSGKLTDLQSFMKDHPKAKPLCVSTCETPYMAGTIPVIPWKHFLRKDFSNIL
jgi:hypothetical protein